MRRATDVNLFVKFSTRPVLNQAKSYGEKILNNENEVVHEIVGAGRPVHDNIDYVLIQVPADRGAIIERPVMSCDARLLEAGAKFHQNCRARKGMDDKPIMEECDVHRFYDEYVAFKSGQEEQQTGTALKDWPGVDRASVEDLTYYKVYTVEQLAGLNDSNAQKFFSLRERARDFLEAAKKGASSLQMRAELDAKDKAMAAMQAQINELMSARPTAPTGREAKK